MVKQHRSYNMQTRNRFLDDIAKMANSAAGLASGMREEIEALVNSRVEKILDRLNLVSREEFDVVKAMLSKSRTEQEKLEERLRKLESQKK
jgi:BMFP domain-containing protein YqiC